VLEVEPRPKDVRATTVLSGSSPNLAKRAVLPASVLSVEGGGDVAHSTVVNTSDSFREWGRISRDGVGFGGGDDGAGVAGPRLPASSVAVPQTSLELQGTSEGRRRGEVTWKDGKSERGKGTQQAERLGPDFRARCSLKVSSLPLNNSITTAARRSRRLVRSLSPSSAVRSMSALRVRTLESLTISSLWSASQKNVRDDDEASKPKGPISQTRAALTLQARYRQHRAWSKVRAMRLVQLEQERLTRRGPNTDDPLGLSIGIPKSRAVPGANATRRWQPDKFPSCIAVELDMSMALGAFEDDMQAADVREVRKKLDFEFLEAPEHKSEGLFFEIEEAAPADLLPVANGPEPVPTVTFGSGMRRRTAAARRTLAMIKRKDRRGAGFQVPFGGPYVHLADLWPLLRKGCKWVIVTKLFTGFVMMLIVGSTYVLCADSSQLNKRAKSGDPDALGELATLEDLNLFFGVAFTLEMAIKILGLGPMGYFGDRWNDLDFAIVIIGWMSIGGSSQIGPLKSLRTLRALRPLRLLSKVPSMQLVIEALIRSLPAIGNVTLILGVFWLVFAILGVQIFGGVLSSCVLFVPQPLAGGAAPLLLPMTAYSNKAVCEEMAANLDEIVNSTGFAHGSLCAPPAGWNTSSAGEVRCRLLWRHDVSGFDNVGYGLLTLVEIATLQGWSRIMYRAMAAQSSFGQGPAVPGTENLWQKGIASIYFFVFVIFGGFILLKFFAGVVIDKFNRLRDERSGMAMMTDEQKEWVETRKLVQVMRPLSRVVPPTGFIRAPMYRFVTHRFFEYMMMTMIMINIAVMAADYYEPIPDGATTEREKPAKGTTDFLELFFTFFFIFEAVVKLIGFGLNYFKNAWNVFDFILVLASIFDIVTGWILEGVEIKTPFNPMLLRLLRLAKVARLIRLIRSASGLRTMLKTISLCLPALANVLSLLALCCLIFATVGMALFGDIVPQEHLGYGGTWPAFDTFPNAMVLMVSMATSERWPDIMRACMVVEPFCGKKAGMMEYAIDDCSQSYGTAVVFFVLYQLIGSLLMMNLTVGVVVDQFSSTCIQESMTVTQTHVLEFQEMWQRLDPDGTYFISCHYLGKLISSMLPPLGVLDVEKRAQGTSQYCDVLQRLEDAWLPVRGHGQVQFQETLFALARTATRPTSVLDPEPRHTGQRLPECELRHTLDKQMRRNLDLREYKNAPVEWNAHEYLAAQMMQRTYRGFRAREALKANDQRKIKEMRISTAFRLSSTLLTHSIIAGVLSGGSKLAKQPTASSRVSS
jgi:hypothetical protein